MTLPVATRPSMGSSLKTRACALWRASRTAITAMCPGPPRVASAEAPASPRPPAIEGLVYELLDAHLDTSRLATDMEHNPIWQAHLEYLTALQRIGRETLAHMSLKEAA